MRNVVYLPGSDNSSAGFVGVEAERGGRGVWEGRVRRGWYLGWKHGVEWLAASGLLLLASPLLMVLAVLVRATSPGPAFYSQTRLGRHGRIYRIYKLRTMVTNAEATSGPVWAARVDARVTPLGRFLRNLHLDELPQLWNVMRGEMCLIGPRPERPELAAQIERDLAAYRGRLAVLPGITGLAQMLAPADDPSVPPAWSVREKLAHDLYYVREVSPWLDLRIAVVTPCHFLAAVIEGVRRVLLGACRVEVLREGAETAGWAVEEREAVGGRMSPRAVVGRMGT